MLTLFVIVDKVKTRLSVFIKTIIHFRLTLQRTPYINVVNSYSIHQKIKHIFQQFAPSDFSDSIIIINLPEGIAV